MVWQVVVVQLLPAVATASTQDAEGTLVVTIGDGQLIVFQPLPALAVWGVHEPIDTVTASGVQVIPTQLLPADAV